MHKRLDGSSNDAALREQEAELRALDARYCSHGDNVHNVATPKLFETCEGSYLYDGGGQAYLDLQMWYSTANFGYANPRLNAALKDQIDTLPQVAPQYLHREKIELSAHIAMDAEAKFGLAGRVHFNVGGSQAMDDAIKLVRNAKDGKSLMFAFEGSYHGRTLGATSITSSYRYRRQYGHFGERAQFIPFPYCFRCPYGKKRDDCELYCVDQFARLFDCEYHGVWDARIGVSEYAAFFIEPLQGVGGYLAPPPGYFEKLAGILREREILLVDDEIQMGMYRTGKLWAVEHFNIRPDVIVFGKAVTNGLNPLSGMWAREAVIGPDVFPPGSAHSTYNANPLGTAVALETFRMAAEGDYEAGTAVKGARFLEGLRELKRRYKIIGDVDGLGLALRMEICEPHDSFTPSKALTSRIVEEAMKADLEVDGRRYGLVLNVVGYYKNVFGFAPSLDISFEEIDLALVLLDQLLRRVSHSREA